MKEGTHKKYSLPHLSPNQSKKSTIFVYPLPIYTLIHIERLLRKIFFSLSLDTSPQSKSLLFLSFQIVQKMQEGAALQVLIHLLSTKALCHPRRVSLTDSDKTHQTPKIKFSPYHNEGGYDQWTPTPLCTKHSCQPTSIIFFEIIQRSKPFPNKPPKLRNSLSHGSTNSKLSLKGKGWYDLSPTKSKALLQRRPLYYLPSTLLYPPPSFSLSILGAQKGTSPQDQLLIIQIPNKMKVPISSFPTLLPKILMPPLKQKEQTRKGKSHIRVAYCTIYLSRTSLYSHYPL